MNRHELFEQGRTAAQPIRHTSLGSLRRADNWMKAADAFVRAVDCCLAAPQTRTRDLGGELGTKAFGDAVARVVAESRRAAV